MSETQMASLSFPDLPILKGKNSGKIAKAMEKTIENIILAYFFYRISALMFSLG
jgi:hypothetical protein